MSASTEATDDDMNHNKELMQLENEYISTTVTVLELDDTVDNRNICTDLLRNGQQRLVKYCDEILPVVFKEAMSENSLLLLKLKEYTEKRWSIVYRSDGWFCAFLDERKKGTPDLYEQVLSKVAADGVLFANEVLFLVMSFLYQPNDERNMKLVWYDLITHGLKSAQDHPQRRLLIHLEQYKTILLHALQKYYRAPLLVLFKKHDIKDNRNLYAVATEAVAQHGWIEGLNVESVKNVILPRLFRPLLNDVKEYVFRCEIRDELPKPTANISDTMNESVSAADTEQFFFDTVSSINQLEPSSLPVPQLSFTSLDGSLIPINDTNIPSTLNTAVESATIARQDGHRSQSLTVENEILTLQARHSSTSVQQLPEVQDPLRQVQRPNTQESNSTWKSELTTIISCIEQEKLDVKDIVKAGELLYTEETLTTILTEILTNYKDHQSLQTLIHDCQTPLIYLLKRHQHLGTFMQIVYNLSRSLGLDQSLLHSISNLSLRMLIDILLMDSDVLVSRIVMTLLSKQNPIPLYNSMSAINKFRAEVFYLWDINHPTILSFGIGQCRGKSSLLNQLFMSSFEQRNNSIYFQNTIDIDFGYHFVKERPVNIADFHGQPTKELIKELQDLFDGYLIQVSSNNLQANINLILEYTNILPREKFRMLIVRDCEADYICPNFSDTFSDIMLLRNSAHQSDNEVRFCIEQLRNKIFRGMVPINNSLSHEALLSKQQKKRTEILKFVDEELTKTLHDSMTAIDQIKNRMTQNVSNSNRDNYPVYSLFVEWCALIQQLAKMTFHGGKIDGMFNLQHQSFLKLQELQKTEMNQCGMIFEDFVTLLSKPNMLLNLDILTAQLKFERKILLPDESQAVNLPVEKNLSIEILWRNAIVSYKYQSEARQDSIRISYRQYIEANFPFEIIDGDNFYLHHDFLYEALSCFKNRRVLVISIVGPQNSGKSTLLNYLFGTLFDVRNGRCTRGVYGSLVQSRSRDFDYIMLIDTEGLSSGERNENEDIEYSRRIVLFCLAVSHLVIVNLKGELDSSMKRIVTLCVDSLQNVGVNRVLKPAVHFILNQNTSSSGVANYAEVIRTLLETLREHHLEDVIQVTTDTFHTLPFAYKPEQLSESNSLSPTVQRTISTFMEETQSLCGKLMNSATVCFQQNKSQFSDVQQWLTFANTVFDILLKFPDLTYFVDIYEKNLDVAMREYIRDEINKELTSDKKQQLINETRTKIETELNEYVSRFFFGEDRIQRKLENNLESVLQQRGASQKVRTRAREFLTTQLTGMKNAWKIAALQANDRYKIEQLCLNGGAELRVMIENQINSCITETKESAEQKFEEMWDRKIEMIRKRFDEGERLRVALTYVYTIYETYQARNLQASNRILDFLLKIENFTNLGLNELKNEMYSIFIQHVSLHSSVEEHETDREYVPKYSLKMIHQLKYLNKNILHALWTGVKPDKPLYTTTYAGLSSSIGVSYTTSSALRNRVNTIDSQLAVRNVEITEVEQWIAANQTLEEYLHPFFEANTQHSLSYLFSQFVDWIKRFFGFLHEMFRKKVLELLSQERLVDSKTNILPLFKIFDFVYSKIMTTLNPSFDPKNIVPIENCIIQRIVGHIEQCLSDVNQELKLFNVSLSKHVSSECHTIAVILLTKLYYDEQLNHFNRQMNTLLSMKSNLKCYYFRMVLANTEMDTAIAESVTQQISILVNKLLKEQFHAKIRNALREDGEEMFTRRSLIKLCDSKIGYQNLKWHIDYIMEPNRVILHEFNVLWSNKVNSINEQLKEERDRWVSVIKDYLFLLRNMVQNLKDNNRSGTQFIDNLFETSTGMVDANLRVKGKLMSIVLYNVLTNQQIDETYTIDNNQYKLTNVGLFETLLKPPLTIVDLMMHEDIRHQYELCSISDLFGLLNKLIELGEKLREEFSSKSVDATEYNASGTEERLRSKALGCGVRCPCCSRSCDFDHSIDMLTPGDANSKHRCITGHQFRAMGGTKLEIINQASIKLCETIKDNDIIVINGDQRIRWDDFKNLYSDWEFENVQLTNELLLIQSRTAIIWRIIGETLCKEPYYPGMKFVTSNVEPPQHFILLLDNSGSMDGQPWIDLNNAVRRFLTIRQPLSMSDFISIIVFGDRADFACCDEEIQSSNLMLKINEKNGTVGKSTDFSNAFIAANKAIERADHHRRDITLVHTIIFLSDGEASYPTAQLDSLCERYGKILKFLAVALGSRRRDVLNRISDKMGGRTVYVIQSSDLERTYAEIASERLV